MASIVVLRNVQELENLLNVPLHLTRLQINDIKVDGDTTNLFIQGRIINIGGIVKHAKAPMFYKKVTIEDETQDQMHIMLTVEENSAEQFRFLKDDTIAVGDLLVVVNVRIEFDPLFPSHSGANVYQAIVNMSSPNCRVLLVKTSHDGSCTTSKHPEKMPTAAAVVNQTVPNPKSQRKEPYVYVKISNLVAPTTVNIFGVVKFIKDPCKTRIQDYSMVITLIDESANSSNDKLKCLLFGNVISKLPSAKPGNIIRFHRLKITYYNNELQGQNGPGFSWVVFDGAVNASLSPTKTSHENNTITEEDQETVRRLRMWAASEAGMLSQDPHSASSSLSGITTGQYFDLICQVVGTCVINGGESLLLKVWDGTQVKLKMYRQDMMSETIVSRLRVDEHLEKHARRYLVDVWVFDDHFSKAMEVKPGDFIKLQNLHALRHKPRPEEEADPDSLSVELCLHGGFSYGRRLTILDPASKEVDELRQILDRELAAATDDSANSIDQLLSEALVVQHNVDSTETTNRLIPAQNYESASNSDDLEDFFTPVTQPQSALSPFQSNRRAAKVDGDVEPNILDGKVAGAQPHVIDGSSMDSTQKRTAAISDEVTVKRRRHDKSAGLENDVAPHGEEILSDSENEIVLSVDENLFSSENNITQSGNEKMFSSENDLVITGQEKSAENEAASLVELQSPSSLGFARDRCMLNTATVMTGHHHIQVTPAVEILRHTPPYKFRFQGFALDYHPKSETASGFLRLYCDRCRYLSPIPCSDAEDKLESSELSENGRVPIFKRIDDGIKSYGCPDCSGVLEYIYMMDFILSDGTEWICAGLWRKQANHFFGCPPVDLLQNPSKYHEIVEKLNLMCFGQKVIKDVENAAAMEQSSHEPQKMECCLMSYKTSHGVAYQIFDTTFAVDF